MLGVGHRRITRTGCQIPATILSARQRVKQFPAKDCPKYRSAWSARRPARGLPAPQPSAGRRELRRGPCLQPLAGREAAGAGGAPADRGRAGEGSLWHRFASVLRRNVLVRVLTPFARTTRCRCRSQIFEGRNVVVREVHRNGVIFSLRSARPVLGARGASNDVVAC